MAWRGIVRLGLALTALLAWSTPALADPPASVNAIQVGVGFRYGFELEEGDFNPWGPGLGISGGYTLSNALYLGGNFDYFFGDSQKSAGIERTGNVWQLMGEAGYDIGLGSEFVLRPKGGAGLANMKAETCVTVPIPGSSEVCSEGSDTYFAIAPGATFMYLGKSFSASIDLRYDMIFAGDEMANALILSAGIGF